MHRGWLRNPVNRALVRWWHLHNYWLGHDPDARSMKMKRLLTRCQYWRWQQGEIMMSDDFKAGF